MQGSGSRPNSPGGDWLVGRKHRGAGTWQIVEDWPTEAEAEKAANELARDYLETQHAVFMLTARYTTQPHISIKKLR